jgi:DNA replication initiation complex subunit (GINS family)
MYDELYAAWRWEIEYAELSSLPSDFYARVADYLKKLKEDNQLVDKKTVKATLLEHEQVNVQRMVQELLQARYRKIVKRMVDGKKVPVEFLAAEEAQLYNGVVPSTDAYDRFMHGILLGQASPKVEVETVVIKRRVLLRFLKAVPSIIGADMTSYGPFMVEDVASVPVENAKILVKQGLAKQVELQ